MRHKTTIVRTVFLSCFLLSTVYTSGQNGVTLCDTSSYLDKMLGEKLLARVYLNTLISNNVQFFNNWCPGDVVLTDGSTVKNELLRYNSLIDELIWLRTNDYSRGIIYKSTVNTFVLYNEKHVPFATFKRIKFKNWFSVDTTDTYLQVLEEGLLSLYVRRRVLNINKSTKELVPKDIFFIKIDDQFYSFSPNRINLYRLMKENKEKMKIIVRGGHFKIRKEQELIQAIKKYNTVYGSN
jgi:hypothetical protein